MGGCCSIILRVQRATRSILSLESKRARDHAKNEEDTLWWGQLREAGTTRRLRFPWLLTIEMRKRPVWAHKEVQRLVDTTVEFYGILHRMRREKEELNATVVWEKLRGISQKYSLLIGWTHIDSSREKGLQRLRSILRIEFIELHERLFIHPTRWERNGEKGKEKYFPADIASRIRPSIERSMPVHAAQGRVNKGDSPL